MTIRIPDRCRSWTRSTNLAVAIGAGLAGPVVAGPGTPGNLELIMPTPTQDARTDEQKLYLEVEINAVRSGRLARFVLRDGQLLSDVGTLRALGLVLAGDNDNALIALSGLPDTRIEYIPSTQYLRLHVPVQLLDKQMLQARRVSDESPRPDPAMQLPGVVLNYDVYAQHEHGATRLSAFSELRLFGVGAGSWNSTFASRINRGGNTASSAGNVRLDSSWQLDFPDVMVSLGIGDGITGALRWTRATRIGGLHLARNFALQPYRVTTPLASFTGEAVLPSTVDLYIDGVRQSSQPVQPGRFQLDGAPMVNGAGQAQLVVTDINGQSRLLGFSLYGTPDLLQPGMSDWSLDVGVIRRGYGTRSFEYDDTPLASTSLRYGASGWLTLEGHAEGSRDIVQAGAGATLLLGTRGGVLSASLAHSQAGQRSGWQYGLGYQWSSSRFAFSASSLRRSRDFSDVASRLGAARMPRRTEQAFAGITTGAGQFGLSYVAQRLADNTSSRHAGINWSRAFNGNVLLSLNLNRDLAGDTGNTAFLYGSIPLDRLRLLSTSARHGRTGNRITSEVRRNPPDQDSGWGWRAELSTGDMRGGRAEITHQNDRGQWNIGLDQRHFDSTDSTLAYAGANGAIGWLGGRMHALRRVDDALALVSTDGVGDVPVYLENRLIGSTNRNGQLLLNRLDAWERNRVSIDPQDLPADMQLDVTARDVVPETRGGTHVRFKLRRALAVQFGVRDRQGHWLPAGSPVLIETDTGTSSTTVVGHEGKVYLLDPPAGARLRVQLPEGTCLAAIPVLPAQQGRLNLGDLTCL